MGCPLGTEQGTVSLLEDNTRHIKTQNFSKEMYLIWLLIRSQIFLFVEDCRFFVGILLVSA